jgi:uncharacterized RDD family membrane protein YckC
MSENHRMREWQGKIEEGNKKNPSLTTNSRLEILPNVRQKIIITPNGEHYVGFWRRVFAFFVDSLILGLVLYFLPENKFLNWIIGFFYYTYWPSTHLQGTIGKMAIGAKIVDGQGGRLTYLSSVGRFFAQLLSFGLFLLGVLMIAFHAKKRGLHDLMANTFVVNK